MPEETKMKEITPRSQDFAEWYTDVVLRAELADYAPVRGCMVIRPYGYAIWENLQRLLDERIKALGHCNAYFPLFIPESLLKKEAEHVQGFSPEVAWVTYGGKEELAERLAIRPTSETVMYEMYAKWVRSYRDLPILINQWANIVRWEKTTRPFLRTLEFLWQEGHTVHATEDDAEAETLSILKMYGEFLEQALAIPVIIGRKTDREKFPGALRTYTVEAMMHDGKALQCGTSHNLGDHFSRAFGIQFLDDTGTLQYAWQTSWGVSTRLIGGIIMTHGDDRGLILPPAIAPYQAVIVPIFFSDKDRPAVLSACADLCASLSRQFRVHFDSREQHTPGWKFHEWEMRGVPVRIEIGPRDLKNAQALISRRDTADKTTLPIQSVGDRLSALLPEIQRELLESARGFLQKHIRDVANLSGLVEAVDGGWARTHWCGNPACEETIRSSATASARAIPLDESASPAAACVVCGNPAPHPIYFARAY
jgi:prolyl-tRNA synthetase